MIINDLIGCKGYSTKKIGLQLLCMLRLTGCTLLMANISILI